MSASALYDVPGPKARLRSKMFSIVGGAVIIGALLWLIVTLGSPRTTANGAVVTGLWDPSRWDIFLDRQLWRSLGEGTLATLKMAAVAAVLAMTIGVLFSFGRTSTKAWIRKPTGVVLEFVRGMPVLLMMFFVLIVFSTGGFAAGVLALGLYNGAIIGEALRAGIAALPRGQREAGLAIGLTPMATRLRIEFPQAFRQMLPVIIAQFVVLLKDTSLAYIVTYVELLRVGLNYMTNYYGSQYFFSLFFVVLAIYLTMNLSLSWLARVIARRTGPKGGGAGTTDDTKPLDPQIVATNALGAQSTASLGGTL